MKKHVPFAHANSLYEIDPGFFVSLGVNLLMVDLDNTLDSYKLKKPSTNAIELIKRYKAAGIEVVITSNNNHDRVKEYADALGVKFTWHTGKPFAGKIKKYLKDNGIKNENVMLVGDQILTDVKAGNRAGLRVILTEKIVPEDQPATRINRIFDKPIRKRLRKKGLLVDWREFYGSR